MDAMLQYFQSIPDDQAVWDIDEIDMNKPNIWDDVELDMSDTNLRENKLLVRTLMDGKTDAFRILLFVLKEIRGLEVDPKLLGVCFAFASRLGDLELMKELHQRGAWIDAFFIREEFLDDPSPYEHHLLDYNIKVFGIGEHYRYCVYGNALYFACSTGRMDIVQYLVEELGMKDRFSALAKAIAAGHTSIAEWMLDHPQCLTKYGVENALCGASYAGDRVMLERLVAIYLEENQKQKYQRKHYELFDALEVACHWRSVDCVSYLLELPDLIDSARSGLGEGFEYRLVEDSLSHQPVNETLVRLLINSFNTCATEYLDIAAKHGLVDIVDFILSVIDKYPEPSDYHSGDLIRPDSYYYNALRCAVTNKQVDVVRLILKKHPMIDEKLALELISVNGGYLPMLEVLVESMLHPTDVPPSKKARCV